MYCLHHQGRKEQTRMVDYIWWVVWLVKIVIHCILSRAGFISGPPPLSLVKPDHPIILWRQSQYIHPKHTHYQTTWCHNPEDELNVHCHENLNILCMILCHNYYIMLQHCQTTVTITPTNNIIGNSAPAYQSCCII